MDQDVYSPPNGDLVEDCSPERDWIIPVTKRVGRLRYFACIIFILSMFLSTPAFMTLFDSQSVAIFIVSASIILVNILWLIVLTFQRTMDIGSRAYWGLLVLVPFVNVLYSIGLLFWKGTASSNIHGKKNNEKVSYSIIMLILAILLYAFSISINPLPLIT